MSDDYAGISARCDVKVAHPGEEAGCELLSDGDFALVMSDHDNDKSRCRRGYLGGPARLRAPGPVGTGKTGRHLRQRRPADWPLTTDATRHSGRCGRPP